MNLQIINPITYPGWDDLIRSNPESSFFHSSSWARVLAESYNYKPLYFAAIDNNKLLALISLMEIKSILTGKRGVSLPFTDYCEPIIPEKKYFKNAMNYLIEYGKRAGWKSIEMRTGNSFPKEIPPSSYYYGHTLELSKDKKFMTQQATGNIENPSFPPFAILRQAQDDKCHGELAEPSPPLVKGGKGGLSNENKIFSNFRDSTRRNIKKAVKEGVETNIYTSVESVREFYRLNCLTRREHGFPPQPWSFFKKIHDHIIAMNLGFVVLASYRGKTIAGAVYFHFGDKALFKYGASDKNYQHLRANNLVMWEAIKYYCQNGYKSLNLGRTEPENKGLLQFKSGWRPKEHVINYYKYDFKKRAFVQNSSRVTGFHNKIFKNMPIPILNVVGSILYKHMG
jgi:hypothetical protein